MDKFLKNKHYINLISFLCLIFALFCLFVFGKDKTLSEAERRPLATANSLKIEDFLKGEFATKLENYSLDQFPFRDTFRELKSFSNYNIFLRKENKDIILKDDYAIKLSIDYNYDLVEDTITKINSLHQKYFSKNKAFIVLVPDKSCFIEGYGKCDFDKVEEKVKDKLHPRIKYHSIYNLLSLEDYYYTDSHWKQNKIEDVATGILSLFNNEYIDNKDYQLNTIENFKGVFASQAALNKTDTIDYLSNDILNQCTVYNYETKETTSIYDLNKLKEEKSLDDYDIFLSGATALLRIDNPVNKNGKTMIVFRDSFGSSIVPLFVEEYETVYVVDIRYIQASLLKNYIDITGKEDVLYIYSTMLVNTPNNFKI